MFQFSLFQCVKQLPTDLPLWKLHEPHSVNDGSTNLLLSFTDQYVLVSTDADGAAVLPVEINTV